MKVFTSIVWILFSCFMIIGGVIGCFMPKDMLEAFALLLPAFLVISAIGDFAYYARIKQSHNAQILLLDGILNCIFAAIFIISGVAFTSLVVVYAVAFLAMFRGILSLVYAFDVRKLDSSIWLWLLLLGILNILVAALFIIYPEIGGLTIGVMISLLILLFGIISLVGFLGMRKLFSNFP